MTRLCLADIAGPFYDTRKPFRNWSALPFYQLDLPEPPYVDLAQLERGLARATAYLDRIRAQGYNGIVIDNLAHLVTFEHAPIPIYRADSPYRRRARMYRDAFGQLFTRAAQLGMDVFVTTDMQWSTPPLRAFAGRPDPRNPRLADLNRWALEELFTTLPQVRGLVVRTGEAGGAHNQDVGYASHMIYTTPASLRRLIGTLLPVCERHARRLIIRTWSLGAGELGDLLWSPQRYRQVFDGFDSPALLVSIKHGPSDFFRQLPHNPTLGLPGPPQIVEVQNRREYELFGMVPSSVGRLHQQVVRHAVQTNARFAGIWAWNSTGGWGGGRAALGEAGWSVWTELSSALTAALLRELDLDATTFVRDWCATRFGAGAGAALADVYLESDTMFEQAWYGCALPDGEQSIGRIYLPPLLWVWWLRPTASLAIWAYLASSGADLDEVVRARAAAIERLRGHTSRLAALARDEAHTPIESVRYLLDVLTTGHAIRSLMETLFTAAWQNQRGDWDELIRRAPDLRARLARHRGRWADNRDFPPLELAEIDSFLRALERGPGLLWLQARAACALVERVRHRQSRRHRDHLSGLIATIVLALALARRSPRAAGIVGMLAMPLLATPLRQQAIKVVLPWVSRRCFLLPSIFFETGPAITEWTA